MSEASFYMVGSIEEAIAKREISAKISKKGADLLKASNETFEDW